MSKFKFISGGNWGESYYTDDSGKLYSASTGSVYIEDFIDRLKLDVDFLDYHPDLVYWDNGVKCNVQDIFPYQYESFNEIPTWTYSKDKSKPLIPQLTEDELIQFKKINNSNRYVIDITKL